MNTKLLSALKYATFLHSKRYANIRGYMREVEVQQGKPNKYDYVKVKIINTGELVKVHIDQFYHTCKGKLIERSIEFYRRYGNHPVEVLEVPSL